jgi:hypothetical protein
MARLLPLAVLLAILAVPAASAAPTAGTKLTPKENAWAVPAVNMMKSLSGRVGAIRVQVRDPAVMTKGSTARKKLTTTLREIVLCGSRMKKNGPPPTARLTPFYVALKSACSYYSSGSAELIVGIATVNAPLIKASMSQILHGSTLLGLAESRLVPLAS